MEINDQCYAQAASSSPLGSEVGGRYRLLRQIGAGGMGNVFEAEDRGLGRRVAIKLLRQSSHADARARRRLAHEARLAACVQHPNVVRLYEFGSTRDLDYVVMELLEGEDLQTRIRRVGRLPIDQVERIAISLASALAAMHAQGVVHRDIKPGNLFLARDGDDDSVLKVLDFGIAKELPEPDKALTDTGQQFGTLLYMAPEQLRGAPHANVQSDLWSAGALLYEALTGRPPFEADSIVDFVLKITSEAPAPLEQARPDTPRALLAAVRRALARDPSLRFASARDFQTALTLPPDESLSSAKTLPCYLPPNEVASTSSAARVKEATHAAAVLTVICVLLLTSAAIRSMVAAPKPSIDCTDPAAGQATTPPVALEGLPASALPESVRALGSQ